MDCLGGEIIRLAMDGNMKKELCIKAAKEAYMLRKPKSGFLFPADQQMFTKIFKKHGVETEIKYERFSDDWSY